MWNQKSITLSTRKKLVGKKSIHQGQNSQYTRKYPKLVCNSSENQGHIRNNNLYILQINQNWVATTPSKILFLSATNSQRTLPPASSHQFQMAGVMRSDVMKNRSNIRSSTFRPIPKRGQVKVAIVLGLTQSLASFFSFNVRS